MAEGKQATFRFRRRRVRTPTVIQSEAVECGAASLGMVLGYFGRHETLEALRLATGVSRDGSKASNLLRAGRAYGMTVAGKKMEPEGLDEIPLPAIIFWNFNHFVVLEGFGRGVAYINDPASGPRKVTIEELDEAFTGVVLTFEKGPEFKKGGRRNTLMPALGRRLRGSELALTYAVVAGLALVVPGLVIPVFSKIFVDNILIGRFDDWLAPLLLGMTGTALLRGLLTWLQQHYLGRMETRIALREAGRYTWLMLRLPMEFFNQRFAGELSGRVKSNDVVARMISGDLATTVINLLTIAFYLVIMWRYDVLLTLIGLGIALLNLAVLRFFARRRADVTLRMAQEAGKLDGMTMGGLQVIETLKATGTETDYFAKWSGYLAKTKNAQMQLGVSEGLLGVVPPFLTALNTTAILTLGGFRVMQGEISMGMLVAFQSLMASFMAPVNQMVELGGQLQSVLGDMDDLDDVDNYPMPPGKKESGEDPVDGRAKLSGHLELRGITFGYSRLDPPLIEKFDLLLRPGSRVALVGGSGSGKSTVSKLVAGLYQPWAGEILFDGVPREDIPRHLVDNSVAMVDQDIFIFGGSVRENLTMWDGTIPGATVVRAARDACIHDDIASRHGGYEGTVEEGGRNWSGGQRQRLEIARALAIDPTILILDEATSALDPKTEKMIDDHLRTRGCSCLIVAHRLSTIRDCDEIIVMDRGKVVQRGTHEEMARDEQGTYYRLIKAE
jgi:NHLM bacteriocin system ABC transporter peptidase/ATP-binding protein